MTLTIQTDADDQQQLALTIEVDEARVQNAMKQKARELGREISIPGFRRGKAPYDVILRRVGEGTLRAETIEDLIQPVFEEALDETGVEPYGRPTLDDIESNPLVFKFTIPLNPEVTLGAYRETRKEVPVVEISDEAVQESLEQVQTRHQTIETVERPAQEGDVVTIGGKGNLVPVESDSDEGEDAEAPAGEVTIFDEEHVDVLLEKETLFPETDFVDNLVGMSAGDDKTFNIIFPDEFEAEPDFAKREAQFALTVLEVKNRDLPPLDDELAKLEGDYETLDDLREAIRTELAEQAAEQAREDLIEEMTDTLLEDAEIVFPPAAVEMQIDDMVADFRNRLAQSGWQYQDYLQLQGMSEEALREDFRENAETQLRRQLTLRQFILDEKLRVSAEDIDEQIEARVARFDKDTLKDSMREYYRSGQGFETISSLVLRDKVYERMADILSGNAPDLADLDAEEEVSDEEE
ncbi:MAG: trigger factor [Chloroflexota bacterium]